MNIKLNQFFWAVALTLFTMSCSETEPERPLGEYETGILIMNEGAFGSNDGEVYHFDPITGELKADIFEAENQRPFAGLLEDVVLHEERLYLVANTGKVEIVNAGDFRSLGAVSGDLDQPRSIAVVGKKLFISDYGPYDSDFNTPASYIAVVDGLNGGVVKTKIPVSSKPEDLFAYGKYVLVAGSDEGKVEIIDTEKETIFKTLEVPGRPIQFFEMRGDLWIYSIGADEIFFQSFHLDNFTKKIQTGFPIPDATGRIAFGNEDLIYISTSSGWPDYNDAISKFSLYDSRLDINYLSGTGIYGIGYDKNNDKLLLAFSKGFQGNGEVMIYDKNANLQNTLTVGRGPSGFFFY
ncbi:YncE family protein [Algoriphagus namhaensis]|uniref:YncE family protein n=1 Tax=Algoriphagus namhaensis TaxID=915353 RepID=A0ABV8ALK6_9BACT